MRKLFKSLKTPRKPSQHLALPPEIHTSTAPPSIDADPGPSNIAPEGETERRNRWGCLTIPAGYNNEESSQTVLEDGGNQGSHILDDVTRVFTFRPPMGLMTIIPPSSTGTRRRPRNHLKCFGSRVIRSRYPQREGTGSLDSAGAPPTGGGRRAVVRNTLRTNLW